MLNPDTHIVLHALHGRLEASEYRLLIVDGNWGISAVVLWQIEKLYQKGRIAHGLDYVRWPLRCGGCMCGPSPRKFV